MCVVFYGYFIYTVEVEIKNTKKNKENDINNEEKKWLRKLNFMTTKKRQQARKVKTKHKQTEVETILLANINQAAIILSQPLSNKPFISIFEPKSDYIVNF